MTIIQEAFDSVDQHDFKAIDLKKPFESSVVAISKERYRDRAPSKDELKAVKNDVQHFLRWALAGGRPGPTLLMTMEILGKDVSLSRIREVSETRGADVE